MNGRRFVEVKIQKTRKRNKSSGGILSWDCNTYAVETGLVPYVNFIGNFLRTTYDRTDCTQKCTGRATKCLHLHGSLEKIDFCLIPWIDRESAQ